MECYLKQYVGEFFKIEDSNKIIYIGSDLPDEYTHSKYTKVLKGANAKAKANAAQGIPELLKIATNELHEENRKEKHEKNAKYGEMYLYDIMNIKKETSNLLVQIHGIPVRPDLFFRSRKFNPMLYS